METASSLERVLGGMLSREGGERWKEFFSMPRMVSKGANDVKVQ